MLSGGSPVSTSLIPPARAVTVQVVAAGRSKGGSRESPSWIWFAITLTAQVVPSGRSAVGSSVAVDVPEPVTVKVFGVPLGHWRVNEPVENVTAWLTFPAMFVFTATLVAPFAGDVVVTAGAVSFGETNTGNSVAVHCAG